MSIYSRKLLYLTVIIRSTIPFCRVFIKANDIKYILYEYIIIINELSRRTMCVLECLFFSFFYYILYYTIYLTDDDRFSKLAIPTSLPVETGESTRRFMCI